MKLKITLTIERQIEVPLNALHSDGAQMIRHMEWSVLESPQIFINNRDAKISVEAVQL
jgi:hypothetical protein